MREPKRREEGGRCLEKPSRDGRRRRGLTVVTKEAQRPLGFERNEGSDEVVDDGCDEDNEQEDLSLRRRTRRG